MRFLTLLLAFALACGSTEPVDAFTGAYDLVSINGIPLPVTFTIVDIKQTTAKGLLIISPKGDWSMAQSGTLQVGTQPPTVTSSIVNGTWQSEGNTITLLSYDPPEVRTAVYSAGTITIGNAVYRKP